MKKRRLLILALTGVVTAGCIIVNPFNTSAANLPEYNNNRIAISCDGNAHDKDDWGATPASLAIIASQGKQNQLVHYDYNSHLWGSSSGWDKQMETSVTKSIDYFNFSNKNIFFNDVNSSKAAIENLTKEIEKSTASNPLYFILAGPAEVLYQAATNAKTGKDYVYVISHSTWNDNNQANDHPGKCHKLSDIKGINVIHIDDQNRGFNSSQNYSSWDWMKNSSDKGLQFIYQRMKDEGKADISDCGMVYYLFTNDENGSSTKLKTMLTNPVEPDDDNSSTTTTQPTTQPTTKPTTQPTTKPTTQPTTTSTTFEAEKYNNANGVKIIATNTNGKKVGYINNNDYIRFNKINLNNVTSITVKASSDMSGGTVEVRQGSTTGKLLGTVKITGTNGWQIYKSFTGSLKNASGTADIYLVFKGSSGYLFDLDSFTLKYNK